MITAFVSLAQNPTGDSNGFPTWVVFLIYALLSACGLAAWALILRRGIRLRVLEKGRPDASDAEENEDSAGSDSAGSDAAASEEKSTRQRCCAQLESLACPPSLRLPVALATVTQVTQWCLAMSFGQIGAMMTDPSSCDGSRGQFVWRVALTASQVLVPCCSLLSSFRRCPQWLFVVLEHSAIFFNSPGALCSLWYLALLLDESGWPVRLHLRVCSLRRAGRLHHHHGLQVHRRCRRYFREAET
ncbi:unnamed protein product [Polarella glacialis]|uniref:Uncharacterized protein n=1 Tax=Polarella glacialis TaxID=89957 RepID=A0A813K3M6_POLGL|nr:unnamed protein product [Polarella glacialis]